MALFLLALPLFLSIAAKPYATLPLPRSRPALGMIHLFSHQSKEMLGMLMEKILTEKPAILTNILNKNPKILTDVFANNPRILWDAQQKMISDFSESVSENTYKSVARILKNSPELWNQMEKKAITAGGKSMIVFLDPLCPHSMLLLRDMLKLARSVHRPWAVCPHWITKHQDTKSQMIVRSLAAAHALGKLEAFLEILIDGVQEVSLEYILPLASQLGMDLEKFQQSMFSPETDQGLLDSRAYGNQFQFQGFPTVLYKKQNINAPSMRDTAFELMEGRPDNLETLLEMLSH
jgi:hypothetical protein